MAKMKIDDAALWLVLIGAVVHLLMGIGQMALIAFVSPFLGLIQIAVGVSGLYLIAKKLKLLK